jgi:hypothetical protein
MQSILYGRPLPGPDQDTTEEQLERLRGWSITANIEIRAEYTDDYDRRATRRPNLFTEIRNLHTNDRLAVVTNQHLAETNLMHAWLRIAIARQKAVLFIANEPPKPQKTMQSLVGDILKWEAILRGEHQISRAHYLTLPALGADNTYNGGWTPYGWDRVEGHKTSLVPIKVEQDAIRIIKIMRDIEECSWNDIRKRLENDGFKSKGKHPLQVRQIQAIHARVRRWHPIIETAPVPTEIAVEGCEVEVDA